MEKDNIDLSSVKVDSSFKPLKPDPKRKLYIYIIPAVLVIALLVFLFRDFIFGRPVEVKLVTVTLQRTSELNAVLTAKGYVIAERKASVASKGTGKLVYLGFTEGDKVKQNQIIAKIEDNDIRAQVTQAKSNLRLQEADRKEAKNNYKRQQVLEKAGASTRVELELAEAHYKKVVAAIQSARAGVLAALAALENTLIRAPFDGTILAKNADLGEIVAPLSAGMNAKSTVVTIADMTSLQVDVDITESDLNKITLNQNCNITLDAYPERVYPGYLAKVIPTADRSKSTVRIKIGFRNYDDKVLPEMSAKVTLLSPDADTNPKNPVLVIPSAAVTKIQGKDAVYYVSDGKAAKHFITTGRQFGRYIEVISGLRNGDSIIDNLSEKIKEEVKVKVK